MPCPHFSISIVKGSKGQSAVASAAYNSGEKLFSERDMKNKDYSGKKEVAEKRGHASAACSAGIYGS